MLILWNVHVVCSYLLRIWICLYPSGSFVLPFWVYLNTYSVIYFFLSLGQDYVRQSFVIFLLF